MLEENGGRAVKERMARQFGFADHAHELQIHERLHVARDVHAANFLDFAFGNRLAVGDDGKRFERGAAQAAWTVEFKHGAHVAAARRDGLQTIGSAGADEGKAGAGDVERLRKPFERLVYLPGRTRLVDVHYFVVFALFRFDGTYRGAQIGGCQRRLAREQKRAYYFLQASWQRYLSFFTHSHGLR